MFPGALSGVGVGAVDPKIEILIPNGSVVTPHPDCKARAVVSRARALSKITNNDSQARPVIRPG